MASRGWAIWITGLPASGKTTVARALCRRLDAAGVTAALLDSDELRPLLAPGAAYGEADRAGFYGRLAGLAALLSRSGVNLVIAATANRRAYREAARRAIPEFAEVWACCPPEVCRARDPKGLYAAAAAGALADLPGAGADYEPPSAPAVTLETDRQSPEEAAELILAGVPFVRAAARPAAPA